MVWWLRRCRRCYGNQNTECYSSWKWLQKIQNFKSVCLFYLKVLVARTWNLLAWFMGRNAFLCYAERADFRYIFPLFLLVYFTWLKSKILPLAEAILWKIDTKNMFMIFRLKHTTIYWVLQLFIKLWNMTDEKKKRFATENP